MYRYRPWNVIARASLVTKLKPCDQDFLLSKQVGGATTNDILALLQAVLCTVALAVIVFIQSCCSAVTKVQETKAKQTWLKSSAQDQVS